MLGADAATTPSLSADETPSPSSSTHPTAIQRDLRYPDLACYPVPIQYAPLPFAVPSPAPTPATFAAKPPPMWPWKNPLSPYAEAEMQPPCPDKDVRRWMEGVPMDAHPPLPPFGRDPLPPPTAPELHWGGSGYEWSAQGSAWVGGRLYSDWDGVTVCSEGSS